MATEKLVTLRETLSKGELGAIAKVKSCISESYASLDALYGAIEKTKDAIGKTPFSTIPPTGGVYDDTTTSTGIAYQSMKAIDALKNRVGNIELAFDSVQETLDAKYAPPTGWAKIFGSKERKKIERQYADELKGIQKTHGEVLYGKLENLEKLLDNLKDKVEADFDSQEPDVSALEAYEGVIGVFAEIENGFLAAHSNILGIVGGRHKVGAWGDGSLAQARYWFGDEYAVFMA